MSTPSLPGLFDSGPVRMSPSAVEARRSGRQRAVRGIPQSMLDYRDALRSSGGATDQEMADILRKPLSAVNARRNEWGERVEACGRKRVIWADGTATSRTVWRWKE